MALIFQKFWNTSRLCTQCLSRTFVYKSVYNVENLYPASQDIFSTFSSQPEDSLNCSDEFKGEIPLKKVKIRYSLSSGPGGQHVNKTMTKAEVRFHVNTAEWIPENLRSIIVKKFRKRINKEGELIVWSDDSRYQLQNVKNCFDQIKTIINKAAEPPDTSKEERIAELNNMESIQEAHKRRLMKKRQRSATKSMRRFID